MVVGKLQRSQIDQLKLGVGTEKNIVRIPYN